MLTDLFFEIKMKRSYEDTKQKQDEIEFHDEKRFHQEMIDNDPNFALLSERNASIEKIAQDMEDISKLFIDIQNLVNEQGTIIDDIDKNIQSTVVHVEDANVELVKAAKSQKKSRKMWLCIATTVVIMIIALSLIITFKSQK
jgi:hypothetical protein